MATSTALRFRNKALLDDAVVQDILPGPGFIYVRELPVDYAPTLDYYIVTIEKNRPGDSIGVTDFDEDLINRVDIPKETIAVNDSLTIQKSQHKIFIEQYIEVVDAGFITDRDILRYRVLSDKIVDMEDASPFSVIRGETVTVNSRVLNNDFIEVLDDFDGSVLGIIRRKLPPDSITVTDQDKANASSTFNKIRPDDVVVLDDYQKSVTRGAFSTVYSKTLPDNKIVVTDDAEAIKSGIFFVVRPESFAVTDFEYVIDDKHFEESLDVADSTLSTAVLNRDHLSTLSLTDDLIVTRSSITNTKTVSESFTVTDLAFGTFISGQAPSVEILHGIEAQ